MNTVYTVSGANTENAFPQHRVSIAGPFQNREHAKNAAEEASRLGYKDVRVHAVEDDR